jgi:hypothetical protein
VLARPAGQSPRTLATTAISLRAALADEHAMLTPGELALLNELLDRLSA